MIPREVHASEDKFRRAVEFLHLAGLLRDEGTTLQITDKFICLLVKNGYADIHKNNSGHEYMKEILMKAVYEGLEAPRDHELLLECHRVMKSMMVINLRTEPDPRAQKILEFLEAQA